MRVWRSPRSWYVPAVFLFLTRRAPSSTLFPYTTLFRSERFLADGQRAPQQRLGFRVLMTGAIKRSEEHTSELQSHSDLVCRLLLEKKKTMQIRLHVCDVQIGMAERWAIVKYEQTTRHG